MTREEGLKQIDAAVWYKDEDGTLILPVQNKYGQWVHAWLIRRPYYCDRGHVQLNMSLRGPFEGVPEMDDADAFPRYFFSFEEADRHARTFLRWRLWQEHTDSLESTNAAWRNAPKFEELKR